jgi:ABC-type lipoprotein export system ATPase subunit
MVTHDPDVAAASDRIVHVLDGRIVASGMMSAGVP